LIRATRALLASEGCLRYRRKGRPVSGVIWDCEE
jgi:hypothetical protein